MFSTRFDSLRSIERQRVLAVVRLDDPAPLRPVLEALAAGGICAAEIALTTPGALAAMATLTPELGSRVLIGAGTVLDPETARLAILAGARFIVGPTFSLPVLEVCHRYDVVAIPGAYSPTEILAAWEAGADIVKLFPARGLGPSYVRDLRGPLPQVRLLPTGGVNADNAAEFLAAGAMAVGVGGNLIDREAVARGDYAHITEVASQLSRAVSGLQEVAP